MLQYIILLTEMLFPLRFRILDQPRCLLVYVFADSGLLNSSTSSTFPAGLPTR